MDDEILLDCDEGRRLGCRSLCCRLIVRLRPGESEPGGNDHPRKSCVDKELEDGLCVYLDRRTHRCITWERRPAICRAYDCNSDPLLQVVIQDGVTSITEAASLVTLRRYRRKVQVPYRGPTES